MQRVILHIDLNSYFASVEQQANPLLRGKPVGVCAYLPKTARGDGCIIASSIEAKKVGVKTGMRISDARKIYPGIILVQNEPAKYRSTTETIFGILAQYTDRVEPYSIDEAFLDLTGWVQTYRSPDPLYLPLGKGEKIPHSRWEERKRLPPLTKGRVGGVTEFQTASYIAQEIQQRITTEVGEWLRASIGISFTRWLAKFGSDIAPKGGVLTITPDNLEKILASVKITEAWGIKHRTAWRLWQLGIATLNDLRRYPVANLLACLGKPGYYLWANVNGVEVDGVHAMEQTQPKSIGHSYCIPKRTANPGYLRPILAKLCEKTGRRLRAAGLEANGIMACCGIVHGHGVGGQRRVPTPLFTTPAIFKAADALLFARPLPDVATMLAISVTDLTPLSGQQSLFADVLKPKNLAMAADRLNDKYGEHTVMAGAMWGTSHNALDRVGYRKTVAIPTIPTTISYTAEPT